MRRRNLFGILALIASFSASIHGVASGQPATPDGGLQLDLRLPDGFDVCAPTTPQVTLTVTVTKDRPILDREIEELSVVLRYANGTTVPVDIATTIGPGVASVSGTAIGPADKLPDAIEASYRIDGQQFGSGASGLGAGCAEPTPPIPDNPLVQSQVSPGLVDFCDPSTGGVTTTFIVTKVPQATDLDVKILSAFASFYDYTEPIEFMPMHLPPGVDSATAKATGPSNRPHWLLMEYQVEGRSFFFGAPAVGMGCDQPPRADGIDGAPPAAPIRRVPTFTG